MGYLYMGLIALCAFVSHTCSIPIKATSRPIAKHVVHIGVDGLKPACIANSSTGSPNMLKRLGEQGTYTLTNARTTIQTVSAPGWSTTLCAMNPTSTGVTTNDWLPPWLGASAKITPVTGNKIPFPCVFATLKKQNPNIATAAFYDYAFLVFLTSGIAGSVDHNFFCFKDNQVCDTYIAGNSTQYLKKLFLSTKNFPSYTFIYFGNVDETGHKYGWCSKQYEEQVGLIDTHVGKILDVIEDAGKSDETLIMLSSDHGGERKDHGYQDDACLIIPMFIKGPSIKKNHKFHYAVHNMDMVPTAVYAMGLQPSLWWTGSIMMEAFEPPS